MKGTKLWQSPGSPIIQGRSRRQRPAWHQWLPAGALASVVSVWLQFALRGPGTTWVHYVAVAAGCLVGAWLGVRTTRAMGWRFAMAWGSVAGFGCAVVVLLVVSAVVPA